MALSDTVKESLRDAQEDLRNALAAAARTEKPFVSKHIADMLAMIDNVIDASEMLEKIEIGKMEIVVSLELSSIPIYRNDAILLQK